MSERRSFLRQLSGPCKLKQTQLFRGQQAALEAAREEMTEYRSVQRHLQAQIDQHVGQIQVRSEQLSQAQDAAEAMTKLQRKLEGMSQLEQDVGALRKLVSELISQKSPSDVLQIDETKKLRPTVSPSVLATLHALPEDDQPSLDIPTFDNGFFPEPSPFNTASSGEEHSKNEATDSASDSGYSSDASKLWPLFGRIKLYFETTQRRLVSPDPGQSAT